MRFVRLLAYFAIAVVVALWIFLAEVGERDHLKAEIDNVASNISSALWFFDRESPAAYLEQTLALYRCESLIITQSDGTQFLKFEKTYEYGAFDDFFKLIGVSPVFRYSSPITFNDAVIGKIAIVVNPATTNRHLVTLLFGGLLALAVYLFTLLIESKRSLARMVDERTAELRAEAEEHKVTASKLRESGQRLSDHFEKTPLGVIQWGLDFTVSDWNPAAQRIFGYTKDEVLGKPGLGLIVAEDAWDTVSDVWDALITGRGGQRSTNENTTKDGSKRICDWYNTTIWDSNGNITGVSSMVMDVTERISLEERLRQAHKMESVGTLAGGIAHDFNNILGAIIGYTELTLIDEELSAEDRGNLTQVLQAANRAKELVKQILMFSRKGKEDKGPLRINLLVEETVKLLRQTIPTTVIIELDLDDQTGMVVADSTQMHQVIMNLGANAYHAMREKGGRLDVRLRPTTVDRETASKYVGLRAGRFALLTVSDTGAGMGRETMARIFDPFFTTKPVGEGTGMGLSVVHGIVQGHGGAIGVGSSPGKGTTFKVFLPLINEAEEVKKSVSEAGHPTGSEHILMVDDELPLITVGQKMLESLGYEVTAVTSPEEALELFKATPEAFNLLVSDQTMPEMTGDALAKEIMKLRAGFPVIICTGYSYALDKTKSEEFGVRAILMKPLDLSELSREIRRALDESQ